MMHGKVLILGGGFAGIKLAISLTSAGADVTLVSKTDFFEASFANARAVVEPGIADQVLIPYSALKPHGKFVLGEVVQLSDSAATLADGQTIEFDYCAICTGSNYAVGKTSDRCTLQQRKAELQALSQRVKAAGSVLIAGGGPLGVELAGEILTDFPGKPVTIIHSGSRLLPTLPPKLGAAAAAWLTQKGCQIILNDRLDVTAAAAAAAAAGSGGFKGFTAGGVAVSGEVVLLATGITINSGFMRDKLPDAVDDQGRIKVDQHLRVVGHPNLFALGDVTNVKEEKLAFLASKQADVVAASIKALLLAPSSAGLRVYKPSMGVPVIFVTLGRNYGVGRIACLTFSGWLPTLIKSRNVTGFVSNYRKQLMERPS